MKRYYSFDEYSINMDVRYEGASWRPGLDIRHGRSRDDVPGAGEPRTIFLIPTSVIDGSGMVKWRTMPRLDSKVVKLGARYIITSIIIIIIMCVEP